MRNLPRPAYVAGVLSVVLGFAMVVPSVRADAPGRDVAGFTMIVSSGSSGYWDAPVTDGLVCSFATGFDPTAEEGTQTGELGGGPVLFTRALDGLPQQGTLVCRVLVRNSYWADHNDYGYGAAVSGHTDPAGLVIAGPQVMTINRTGTENVFLCPQFIDDWSGVTYYWDDDFSEWSPYSGVPCRLSVTGDDGSGGSDLEILIDSIVCPILALVFPPEGDIPGIWDCPPYGNNGPLPTVGPTPTVTPPPVTPPPVALLGCDDGLDNDSDGAADYPADPGCDGPSDADEHNAGTACDDGVDNDVDGAADYPADPGCSSRTDTNERGGSACDDGADNDNDGWADYPSDPGCDGPTDSDESNGQCNDRIDNDGDGATDFGSDIGCTGPADANEHDATFVCDNGLDDDGDGLTDYPSDTGCSNAADPNERTIP